MAKRDGTIFDRLKEEGIVFAVASSALFISNVPSQMGRDWFIVGSVKDKAVLKKHKFKLSKSRRGSIMEYDLSDEETRRFKNMTTEGDLIRVVSSEDGKVYEQKNKSFKEYYES